MYLCFDWLSFLGPPLVGLLVEYFQHYVYPFYIAGAIFGLGGVFYFMSDWCLNSTKNVVEIMKKDLDIDLEKKNQCKLQGFSLNSNA